MAGQTAAITVTSLGTAVNNELALMKATFPASLEQEQSIEITRRGCEFLPSQLSKLAGRLHQPALIHNGSRFIVSKV